jgi:hypothetical protein
MSVRTTTNISNDIGNSTTIHPRSNKFQIQLFNSTHKLALLADVQLKMFQVNTCDGRCFALCNSPPPPQPQPKPSPPLPPPSPPSLQANGVQRCEDDALRAKYIISDKGIKWLSANADQQIGRNADETV